MLITKRTNAQRKRIKNAYYKENGSDLIKDLQKTLTGHFEDVVVGLFYSPIDYDCFQLRKAMKGLGTDEGALIEILCTRPPSVIKKISKRYSEMYPDRSLLKDIQSDTSGNFRKILVSLVEAKRPMTNNEVDYAECEKCAKSYMKQAKKE